MEGTSHGLEQIGDPNGEVTTWELERLVRRRPSHKRRTREKVTITYCVDGWQCGTDVGNHACPTLCAIETRRHMAPRMAVSTLIASVHSTANTRWFGESAYGAGHRVYTYWYCDPELPDGYRELVTPSA